MIRVCVCVCVCACACVERKREKTRIPSLYTVCGLLFTVLIAVFGLIKVLNFESNLSNFPVWLPLFVFSLKILWLLRSEKYESFIVLSFTFMSTIHPKFVVWGKSRVKKNTLLDGQPVDGSLLEKATFSSPSGTVSRLYVGRSVSLFCLLGLLSVFKLPLPSSECGQKTRGGKAEPWRIHLSGTGSCGYRRRTGVEGWWTGEPGIVGCSGRPVSGRFMVHESCTLTREGEGSELCRVGFTVALTVAGVVRGKPGDSGFERLGREGCCGGGLVGLYRGNERIGMASGGQACRQDGSPWRAGDVVSCTFVGWSRREGR